MISKRWRWVGLLCLGVLFGLASAGRVAAQAVIAVSAEDLATAVSNANPGDTIQVTGGVYHGSLEIDKPLTIIGVDWPVIDGGNQGTVLKISGAGTSIRGFLIQNSGSSLDQENTGIAVEAHDVLVEGNRFIDTLFGIYLRGAHGTTVRDNTVTSKDLEVQRRGDQLVHGSAPPVL